MANWIGERDSGRWLAAAIRYFRRYGFFTAPVRETDEQVIDRVRAYHGGDWDELLQNAPDSAAADQYLVMADTSRVWFRDLECVCPGEDAYASTLREWAAISRGLFEPEEIAETWFSEHGPVHVTFRVGGVEHTFVHHDGHDDCLDMGLLRVVNGVVARGGYHLEASDNLGDCRFIVALDRRERTHLAQERGWKFCLHLSV